VGERFDVNLAWQAVVMIGTQLLLLDALVGVKARRASSHDSIFAKTFYIGRQTWEMWLANFWNWPCLSSYIEWLLCFTAALGFDFLSCQIGGQGTGRRPAPAPPEYTCAQAAPPMRP
jgi:hypothetical protein